MSLTRRNFLRGIAGIVAISAGLSCISDEEKSRERAKEDKSEYKEGVVIRESGNFAGLEDSSGAVFGNRSVKIGGGTYVLHVKTSDATYTFSVYQSDKPLEALALAIEEGTKIRFRTKGYFGGPCFSSDNIGWNKSDDVSVLK